MGIRFVFKVKKLWFVGRVFGDCNGLFFFFGFMNFFVSFFISVVILRVGEFWSIV